MVLVVVVTGSAVDAVAALDAPESLTGSRDVMCVGAVEDVVRLAVVLAVSWSARARVVPAVCVSVDMTIATVANDAAQPAGLLPRRRHGSSGNLNV